MEIIGRIRGYACANGDYKKYALKESTAKMYEEIGSAESAFVLNGYIANENGKKYYLEERKFEYVNTTVKYPIENFPVEVQEFIKNNTTPIVRIRKITKGR